MQQENFLNERRNKMKKFEAPELSVEKFAIEDVITASIGNGGNGDNNTGDQEM